MTVQIVAEADRKDFLVKNFGGAGLRFEQMVYAHADRLCPEYSGGYWEFAYIKKGKKLIPFMYLESDKKIHMVNPMNHGDVKVSNIAMGLVVSLFALEPFAHRDDKYCNMFHAIRDYIISKHSGAYPIID